MNITIVRGYDGFGSQLLSILSGIAYAKKNNWNYFHTPINGIKLVGKPINTDTTLIKNCNKFVSDIMMELKIPETNNSIDVKTFPFFHKEIFNDGVENYYNDDFFKYIQKGYVQNYPKFYNKNEVNIAIHIRRGDDILKEDKKFRWIDNSVYENIIGKLLEKYKNAIIHIFSWNNPNIKIYNKNIFYHISNDENNFLDDFNCLVHADILVVGSSTFSISAGMFNKNKVVCDDSLCKLLDTPIPVSWKKNYANIIN